MSVLKPRTLIICIGSSFTCFSQEKTPSVIASAGDISKGGGIILEWSVGETIVETVGTATALYTQGFHQSDLQVKKISQPFSGEGPKYTIQVYPNPATSVIHLQLEKPAETDLLISVLDAAGKLVLNSRLVANSSLLKLPVSQLSNGIYIMRIIDAKGTMQYDFKIIKAQ